MSPIPDNPEHREKDELEKLRVENEQLKSRLEEVYRVLRKLPVEVNFRKAATGAGDVLQIAPASRKDLSLFIRISSSTFGTSYTFEKILSGASFGSDKVEIGHLEGRAIAPGDVVEISSVGFDTVRLVHP